MKKITAYTQELRNDENGCQRWYDVVREVELDPEKTALMIVDMWDRHWSTGATRRCAVIAEGIDKAAKTARQLGMLVVHSPSETMQSYTGNPARERFLADYDDTPAPESDRTYPPSPLDSTGGGSDTPDLDEFKPNTIVWKKETEIIHIDTERDIVTGDEGEALFNYLKKRGYQNLIYAGVHTNMCVVGRSFGIKHMQRRGMNTFLCRDLTDTMYNPNYSPYVNHDEGTRIFTSYVEKFICPTIDGKKDLM